MSCENPPPVANVTPERRKSLTGFPWSEELPSGEGNQAWMDKARTESATQSSSPSIHIYELSRTTPTKSKIPRSARIKALIKERIRYSGYGKRTRARMVIGRYGMKAKVTPKTSGEPLMSILSAPGKLYRRIFFAADLPLNSSTTPIVIGKACGYEDLDFISSRLLGACTTAPEDCLVVQLLVIRMKHTSIYLAAMMLIDPWFAKPVFPRSDDDRRDPTALIASLMGSSSVSPILILPSWDSSGSVERPNWIPSDYKSSGPINQLEHRSRTESFFKIREMLGLRPELNPEFAELIGWLQKREKSWGPLYVRACVQERFNLIVQTTEYKAYEAGKKDKEKDIPPFVIPPNLKTYGRHAPAMVAQVFCTSAMVTGYAEKLYQEIADTEDMYYRKLIGIQDDDDSDSE
ncbi:hypothetical protein SISSUDRAFT_1058659 [Sistotremastrum suecicum HHB10207 ss-3]|uniref:Uncharacterized protein n=1 Tax=Sistotremastrum suecicum HHB10207 ss-3 TaxID=1314776 RepID=A0A166H3C3_9AGAM|nr:hypothetical protein SISSUDRAFT_1058659 [Sistotremastrum suecicum HHB10207 ss-3]